MSTTKGAALIRASNGLLLLAAVLVLVGLLAGVTAVWLAGVVVLVLAIVLAVVHSVRRGKRVRSS